MTNSPNPNERAHPTSSPRGKALLDDRTLTRGTAYTEAERRELGLEGLLPATVDTLETQVHRVLGHLEAKPDDLEKYIYLQGLCDRNETLFYATLMSDPARFVPIVYDPTIAEACLKYGHLYRRPQGMYLTRRMRGRLAEVLAQWPVRDIHVVCVSSGGRILGLGDIGANGAPIPIGKLQLYTACAGVPPRHLLPIHLDLGTTDAALREDLLYTGLREAPPGPQEVDALVDEFMAAVAEVFPGCCVHFEDWKGDDAIRLLARHQDRAPVYNDDIQGTAAVVLAGLITALRAAGQPLGDQRLLFAGAGSAGTGIARLVVEAMVNEGLTREQARERVTLFDAHGLVERSRRDLTTAQQPYARDLSPLRDLQEAVEAVRPTALIGTSTVGGLFTEGVVRAMAKLNPRPILFALSNPTERAECTAQQACEWTGGKALYAAGVQFPPVKWGGRVFHPGQANNVYVFPGLGLAIHATRPDRIDDRAFLAAAKALAEQVGPAERDRGLLYPPQERLLETEVAVAVRVAESFFAHGQATVDEPQDVRAWIEGLLYRPVYGGDAAG